MEKTDDQEYEHELAKKIKTNMTHSISSNVGKERLGV